MFSKRQMEILSYLAKAKEPVAAEWIAKELNVSDRTVRNEIKIIQPECPKLGISIESIRGKGYQLQLLGDSVFLEELNQLKEKSNNKMATDFSNQNDRVVHILKQLLLEKEPIKLESFEDEMYVSKSTIQNDLKTVRKILAKFNLTLVNRPHHGTQVEGEEYMKRLCLSNYILDREHDFVLNHKSFQLLDQELFQRIKEIIIKKVNKYKIEISDISLANLAVHITIACKRIEEGFFIEPLKDHFIDEYPFEKIVAEEIVEEVEACTELVFPPFETNYIIVHLLGTKLMRQEDLMEYSEFDEAGTIVQCMLKRLKRELNWDFSGDHELIQALTLHIRPAMNRLRYKMNIRNPLLNEIKVKYPSAFEGAVIASKCIEDYLSIDPGENEIAYIALHIAVALERMKSKQRQEKRVIVVCASGVGSSKLLSYRLQRLFEHDMEIVHSTNYYKLGEMDLSSIDLIISTIPIKEDLGIPVLVVNTFLGDEDILQIRDHLSSVNQKGISYYLEKSRVFLQQELQDKKSVIHFLSQMLMKQGLVDSEYEQLVLDREEISPTSFGNLVAIPHPITPVTKDTFWTVCTLKDPISWGNQMIQFVCLLNVCAGPTGDLDRMYKALIQVIENKTIVQKMIKSESAEEVIRLLHEN